MGTARFAHHPCFATRCAGVTPWSSGRPGAAPACSSLRMTSCAAAGLSTALQAACSGLRPWSSRQSTSAPFASYNVIHDTQERGYKQIYK